MIPFRIMNGTIVKNCGKKNKPRDYYIQIQLVCAHVTVAGNPDLAINSSALSEIKHQIACTVKEASYPQSKEINSFQGSETQEKNKLSTRHTLPHSYPAAPPANSCASLLQLPLFYFKRRITIIIVSEILPENLLCI